jgi:hypothetical protein
MIESLESKTPSDAAACSACGVSWVDHLGITGICDAAEDMRDLLREIFDVAQLPANAAPDLHHRALVAICHLIEEKTTLRNGAVHGMSGKLVGFDGEAMTLTVKMRQMPAAATLGERVVLRLSND